MLKLIFNITILMIFSCNGLNQNLGVYNLRLNESQKIKELGNQIEVLEIQDSRCPKGANCITEGFARIKVKVIEDKSEKIIEFRTDNKKEIFTDYFQYKIIDLIPYPEINKDLELKDYIAVISIEQR
jgi:hypothetical protein